MFKTCTKCLLTKEISEFHKRKTGRGVRSSRGGFGVNSVCKFCTAEARAPGIHARSAERSKLIQAGLKRCGTCDTWKPSAEFHQRKASSDGLAYSCHDCVKKRCSDWRESNPGAFSRWYKKNAESRSEKYRNWRELNVEKRTAYMAAWLQANKARVAEKNMRRYATKMKAAVKWADVESMRKIYEESAKRTAETGIKHNVDHIIPLQGKNVCGLHWEGNLQVLTQFQNISKLNRV